jgi:hypothetical protein
MIPIWQIILCHNTEEHNTNPHRRENVLYITVIIFFVKEYGLRMNVLEPLDNISRNAGAWTCGPVSIHF